ncbi:PREDICTED: enkurin isoform X2 [Ficedula albicollis]|uniref:enkurin isoform X2 n=1 Tax=Ficedula albicollis TaxID=59894 RepID=UPI0003599ABC|nr:PREDICTED: enkurin isoform X2 [Ficedula albicollis]
MATQSAQEGASGPPPQPAQPGKPARYVSKYSELVRREAEKNKSQWKTMGPAKVAVPSPNDFLQKRSKEPKLAPKKKEQEGEKLLPLSVPGRTYHPVIRIKKNFIYKNAVAVIRGKPKNPRHFCVDTRQGDKYLLEPSGLFPKYIRKKNYGVIPKYVTRRNEEMKRAEEEYQASVLEELKKKAMKTLSEEERTDILKALKKNWEEVNRAFQTLPVLTDTRYKRMQKEELELKLQQLEHDIAAIEKHKTVYIANV